MAQVERAHDPVGGVPVSAEDQYDAQIDAAVEVAARAVGEVAVSDRPIDNLRSLPVSLREVFPDQVAEIASEAVLALFEAGWRPVSASRAEVEAEREAALIALRDRVIAGIRDDHGHADLRLVTLNFAEQIVREEFEAAIASPAVEGAEE